jgi:hypothetical protein
MTRQRVDDWDHALMREIERQRSIPFQWSISDCLTFVLDCVEAVTGEYVAADLEWPAYATADEAYAALHALGYENLSAAFDAHFLPIHPAWAGRGDIAVIVHEQGLTSGIFVGASIACKEPAGVALIERSRAVRAWRV